MFVLGVDLDGVCGDHTGAFREVVAREKDVDPAGLGPQTTWTYEEWGLDEKEFLHLHRRAVLDHRMFRTMPVLDGAAEALWRLSDAGVWIRLITHRLYANWGHAVAVADTVAWLDDNGIPYRDLCFLGQKPQVEADAYIDDAPHNIAELRASGATVIIYDQLYNRELPGLRARSWVEAEQHVVTLLTQRGLPVQEPLPGLDYPGNRLQGRLDRPENGSGESTGEMI